MHLNVYPRMIFPQGKISKIYWHFDELLAKIKANYYCIVYKSKINRYIIRKKPDLFIWKFIDQSVLFLHISKQDITWIKIAFRLSIDMTLSQKEKYLRNICIPLINVNKIKTVSKTHLGYPHTPTYRSKFEVILRSRLYTTSCLLVIQTCAKIWYDYVKEKRRFARLNSWWKYFWYWGYRSRSYRVNACSRCIVPWWFTHVPNKVWLSQRTKKTLNSEHKVMT